MSPQHTQATYHLCKLAMLLGSARTQKEESGVPANCARYLLGMSQPRSGRQLALTSKIDLSKCPALRALPVLLGDKGEMVTPRNAHMTPLQGAAGYSNGRTSVAVVISGRSPVM